MSALGQADIGEGHHGCPLNPQKRTCSESALLFTVCKVPHPDIGPAKLRYSPGPFVDDSFSITLFRLNEAGF